MGTVVLHKKVLKNHIFSKYFRSQMPLQGFSKKIVFMIFYEGDLEENVLEHVENCDSRDVSPS